MARLKLIQNRQAVFDFHCHTVAQQTMHASRIQAHSIFNPIEIFETASLKKLKDDDTEEGVKDDHSDSRRLLPSIHRVGS